MKKIILGLMMTLGLAFAAFNDAGTDYTTKSVESGVQESSLNALATVNKILYIINASKAESNVNQGTYETLIKSYSKGGDTQAGSTSSAVSYERMIANVTRTDNNSNMLMKFWLYLSGEDQHIARGHIEIEESVSEKYPLGKFILHYGIYVQNDLGTIDEDVKPCKGTLDITNGAILGQSHIRFKEACSEPNWLFSTSLDMLVNTNNADVNGDGTIAGTQEQKGYGYGFSKQSENGNSQEYKLLLGDEYYLIIDSNQKETTKNKNNEIFNVWRYGLFNFADGSKVALNGGLEITKADGTGGNGWIGYNGAWIDSSNPIANGDEVKKRTGSSSEVYTLFKAPGKLIKHTKKTIDLEKLHNTTFQYGNYSTGMHYLLSWDKNQTDLKILGQYNDEWILETNSTIDNKYLFDTTDGDQTGILTGLTTSYFWSYALNSNVNIKADSNNSTALSYYDYEIMQPSDDLVLKSFSTSKLDPTDQNGSTAVSWNNDINASYTFDSDTMTLLDANSTAVAFHANVENNSFHLSPLLTSQRASETSYNINNYWTIQNTEEVYYSWETGNNDWNQLVALKDADGDFVAFDKPLKFGYEHTQNNDMNNDANNSAFYNLEFDGNSLNGFPWTQNEDGSWTPAINIKAGTTLTDSDNNKYVVKPIGIDIYYGTVDNNAQSDLSFDHVTISETYTGADYDIELVNNVGPVPADPKQLEAEN